VRTLLIKALLYFFALFPLRVIHALATQLGTWLAHRPQLSLTKITRINIRLCFPHLSENEQNLLIETSLIETAKTFTELSALWLWRKERVLGLVRRIDHEACLQQAMQAGKGVILLTPHLGAWELVGLYASCHYPFIALYRPPKLIGLQNLIQSARQRAGGKCVAIDQAGVRVLLQTLRRGEMIGILPDQVPQETNAGIFAPFFNIPTYTMILVSRLAQKTGAPVIFTYAQRLPKGQGFSLHFLPAPTQIHSPNLVNSVLALNQGIQQCILTCPEQYQWSYKRFKRAPEGTTAVY
jgi:KDO2-lipid IV(A) lauroyltransferase